MKNRKIFFIAMLAVVSAMRVFAGSSVPVKDTGMNTGAGYEDYENRECLPLSSLFDNPYLHDGTTVTVCGEAVGDIMRDGETFWVNIKCRENVFIGIAACADNIAKIEYLGRYGVRGDTVMVTGIYRTYCSEHYGTSDIHADVLNVISPGYEIEEEIKLYKIVAAFAMGLSTLFFILYSSRRNSRRDNTGRKQ